MIILGVNIGEISSAALMINCEIVAAAQEERFTGIKNFSGYPGKAIEFCLSWANICSKDIDIVAINGQKVKRIWFSLIQRLSAFSVQDYVKEAHEYWYPTLYENKQVDYLEIFKDKLSLDTYPEDIAEMILENKGNESIELSNNIRTKLIFKHLGVSDDKIIFTNHHLNHCNYGYYGSPYPLSGEGALVFTADSFGDDCNASINTFNNRKHSLIFKTCNQNLGRLYRNITVLLGMKPYEHEYKVMGLAAYAPKYLEEQAYNVFKRTLNVNGIDFVYKEKPKDSYFWFKERLEGIRFDGIAAGLQRYFEELMTKWIQNGIKETGLKKVAFSGGLSMNIKLNQIAANLPEVDELFVAASGDDFTLAIGACFTAMSQLLNDNDLEKLTPLKNVYLGPDISDKSIETVIRDYKLNEKCLIIKEAPNDLIASKLKEDKIIARCAGRMEFGARALGNRSIIANPGNINNVERINRAVKNRDFWMPFAPSVIEPDWDSYLINPKKMRSPYMTIGFNTTKKALVDMPACLHQADKTCRPQMLKKEANEPYYKIIEAFKNLTGTGAVLNTSFNIHGKPIVTTAQEAVEVFLNTEIDALLLNNVFIEKKARGI